MAASPKPLPGPRAPLPKRVVLAALMAVIGVNVWTGGPLLALWIGSRLQAQAASSLTISPMTALAVIASLVAITLLLTRLLKLVAVAYDRAIAATPRTRQRASWLGGEGHEPLRDERPPLVALERILVVTVIIAALAFEVWFFFFSTSPIDQRSGRGSVPLAQMRLP